MKDIVAVCELVAEARSGDRVALTEGCFHCRALVYQTVESMVELARAAGDMLLAGAGLRWICRNCFVTHSDYAAERKAGFAINRSPQQVQDLVRGTLEEQAKLGGAVELCHACGSGEWSVSAMRADGRLIKLCMLCALKHAAWQSEKTGRGIPTVDSVGNYVGTTGGHTCNRSLNDVEQSRIRTQQPKTSEWFAAANASGIPWWQPVEHKPAHGQVDDDKSNKVDSPDDES